MTLLIFSIAALAGFLIGIGIALLICVYEDARRDDFDDSLERLRAAARHPSQRIP